MPWLLFWRRGWLGLAMAGGLAGCGKMATPSGAARQTTPTLASSLLTAAAAAKTAPDYSAIALLEGSTVTEIRTEIGGYLIRQDYKEGAWVKRGEVLFEMDPRSVTGGGVKMGEGGAKILAPVEGVAGRATHGLGDLLLPGTVLTTVSRIDPIRAVFALPRKVYLAMVDGTAQGSSEAVGLLLFDGTVYPRRGKWESVDAGASGSNQPVTIEALFPNPDGILRPGEYVKIRGAKP